MSKFVKLSQSEQGMTQQSAQVIKAISKSKPTFTIEDVTANLFRIAQGPGSEQEKNEQALEYLQKVNSSLSGLQSLMKTSPEISSALASKGVKL